ncbi:MAG: HPr kinase/phosphorylase [Spirochaetes bacterium GWD1_61_31]|nr:MAG: HPr kinase/phosphorylase [Spirochaetes bacterium GWB1_60_80]OHD31295.1 MAG: HPr kinase/phosphorylase [Spirochaetes bacterium GWC1_61_12]OHD39481.1 MAG: HPr kinase/phosphorylase [Spirochaetes bacterium GWD1_61_31]OHD45533.1 MAG: HPr kinase/phosphorylase [Spirochaetes bacterium GWE1_60_18]OHD58106.1 MAG: HPr kinase/phosphorylase [Spirochaetes bacterium GWF1_60_12]HAP44678.1 HPr kinase/phosphorylase [Spirochaetaceae bacterium]
MIETKDFTVLDLLDMDLKDHDDLQLRCIAGRKGLGRVINLPDINRPGLALSGFYENFAWQRVQVMGLGENAYIRKLFDENKSANLTTLFGYDIPCFIFTNGAMPEKEFLALAEERDCPVLITDLSSTEFMNRLMRVLSGVFAPKTTVHGVLVEVYGIGILLTGDSGVGKSETALELIERGHRLVADDVVEIRCVSGNILMGSGANKVIGHHMEIRGLGIINVTHLFGVRAIRDKKQVQLICNLEEWDTNKVYDRIGTDEKTQAILDVHIPHLDIPVKPGRNIPIIIETAAMNERLKKMGYHSAQEFNKNILRWLESESARAVYFGRDDSI